jgi:hypothetical protein
MGQKTQRSRACPSHALPRSRMHFLNALLSYDAVALHRGQCEQLLRYGKLATSSISLLGGGTAIDDQLATGDEGRLIRGEVQNAVGDILWPPYMAQRYPIEPLLS